MATTKNSTLQEQDSTLEVTTQHSVQIDTSETDFVIQPAIAGKRHYVIGMQYYVETAHTLTIKSDNITIYQIIFPSGGGISASVGNGCLAWGKIGGTITLSVNTSVFITMHTTTSATFALRKG